MHCCWGLGLARYDCCSAHHGSQCEHYPAPVAIDDAAVQYCFLRVVDSSPFAPSNLLRVLMIRTPSQAAASRDAFLKAAGYTTKGSQSLRICEENALAKSLREGDALSYVLEEQRWVKFPLNRVHPRVNTTNLETDNTQQVGSLCG